MLEVVEVARDVEDRGPKFRGPVCLDPLEEANSRPSETVDLDEDVVARNTLAETNIARSTSRASNDSNRISIASQEDFKF